MKLVVQTSGMHNHPDLRPDSSLDSDGSGHSLFVRVYEELKALAARQLGDERQSQTLQPTALVHEVWLKLLSRSEQTGWKSRAHFFHAAAEAMRRILIDYARRRQAKKRRISSGDNAVGDAIPLAEFPLHELLDLDSAIEKLESVDATCSEMVRLRLFAGLSVEDVAGVQQIPIRTAYRNWAFAQSWLFRELNR